MPFFDGNDAAAANDVPSACLLSGIKDKLPTPELIAVFVREFTEETNSYTAQNLRAQVGLESEFADVNCRLAKLMDAIEQGASRRQRQCGGPHPNASDLVLVYDLSTRSSVNWQRLLPKSMMQGTSADISMGAFVTSKTLRSL